MFLSTPMAKKLFKRAFNSTGLVVSRPNEKHMREQGFSPAKIQAEVLKRLQADKDYKMFVAENTKAHKEEIREIIKKTVEEAKKRGDQLIAEAGGMAWNSDLSMWAEHGVDLKKPNTMSQLVAAFQKQTIGTLRNLTRTTGFKNVNTGTVGIMNVFQNELDFALLNVVSGTFSYDQAVTDCIKRLAQSGLRHIDYASGKSYQLDTAVRMCVRTGCSQLAGKIMEENLKSTGQDLVITSQHMGSRPEHAPWQNKVFSYSGKSKKYPDFFKETGYGTVDGLKGANCAHDFYPFWEGASVIPDDIVEPEPKTINGKKYTYYQCTQKQRSMERDIRALKREINATETLGMDATELKSKLRWKKQEYVNFSAEARIRPKENRLRIVEGSSDVKRTKAYNRFKELEKKKENDKIELEKYNKMLERRMIVQMDSNTRSLSMEGTPDSIADLVDEIGNVKQRRVYGVDGKAVVDYDTTDHNKPKYHPTGAHKHEYNYDNKNPHGRQKPLSEFDLKKNEDIIRKGENYNEPKT